MFCSESIPCFSFEVAKYVCDLRGSGRQHHGARELAAQIGVENAESRKRTGSRGNENAAYAQRLSQGAGVERTGAAEREQSEVARIETAFDRDAAQR